MLDDCQRCALRCLLLLLPLACRWHNMLAASARAASPACCPRQPSTPHPPTHNQRRLLAEHRQVLTDSIFSGGTADLTAAMCVRLWGRCDPHVVADAGSGEL